MAWRVLTEDDLVSFLSQKEVDAYRRSADFTSDVLAAILVSTGNFVRGHVRASGVRLCPVAASIPDSLVSPALDYAVYDVLKRFRLSIGDDRRKAREQAIALFTRVADGKLAIESGVEEVIDADASMKAVDPEHATVAPPRLLD